MGDKFPQATTVLMKRLRRAAKGLRALADSGATTAAQARAWANTCDQAAGRLADYLEGRPLVDMEVEDDGEARR